MNVDQIMVLAKSEAALRVEVERLTAERAALRETIAEQLRTIDALMVGMPEDGTTPVIRRIAAIEAERDALLADAERYRWLRENFGQLLVHTDGGTCARHVLRIAVCDGLLPVETTSVDAAIDAARKA